MSSRAPGNPIPEFGFAYYRGRNSGVNGNLKLRMISYGVTEWLFSNINIFTNNLFQIYLKESLLGCLRIEYFHALNRSNTS